MASRFNALRVALLTLVLAVHTLLALPSPSTLDHERLGTPDGLQQVADGLSSTRDALLRPFVPALQLTGTGQAWAMFAQPDRTPRRLEVHVERDGRWHPLFVKNRLDHPTLGPVLRDRRVRALYDTTPDDGRPAYWNLTRWIARTAASEDPSVERVRIRLVEVPTTDPWDPPSGDSAVFLERIHTRVAVMPEDDP